MRMKYQALVALLLLVPGVIFVDSLVEVTFADSLVELKKGSPQYYVLVNVDEGGGRFQSVRAWLNDGYVTIVDSRTGRRFSFKAAKLMQAE